MDNTMSAPPPQTQLPCQSSIEINEALIRVDDGNICHPPQSARRRIPSNSRRKRPNRIRQRSLLPTTYYLLFTLSLILKICLCATLKEFSITNSDENSDIALEWFTLVVHTTPGDLSASTIDTVREMTEAYLDKQCTMLYDNYDGLTLTVMKTVSATEEESNLRLNNGRSRRRKLQEDSVSSFDFSGSMKFWYQPVQSEGSVQNGILRVLNDEESNKELVTMLRDSNDADLVDVSMVSAKEVESKEPSSSPTSNPTWNPTVKLSGRPTDYPTMSPSDYPTLRPSVRPSDHPTSRPSGRPSNRPTGKPTAPPSAEPTPTPSTIPTNPPSTSIHPSMPPTLEPTTLLPAISPSTPPSFLPSSKGDVAIPGMRPDRKIEDDTSSIIVAAVLISAAFVGVGAMFSFHRRRKHVVQTKSRDEILPQGSTEETKKIEPDEDEDEDGEWFVSNTPNQYGICKNQSTVQASVSSTEVLGAFMGERRSAFGGYAESPHIQTGVWKDSSLNYDTSVSFFNDSNSNLGIGSNEMEEPKKSPNTQALTTAMAVTKFLNIDTENENETHHIQKEIPMDNSLNHDTSEPFFNNLNSTLGIGSNEMEEPEKSPNTHALNTALAVTKFLNIDTENDNENGTSGLTSDQALEKKSSRVTYTWEDEEIASTLCQALSPTSIYSRLSGEQFKEDNWDEDLPFSWDPVQNNPEAVIVGPTVSISPTKQHARGDSMSTCSAISLTESAVFDGAFPKLSDSPPIPGSNSADWKTCHSESHSSSQMHPLDWSNKSDFDGRSEEDTSTISEDGGPSFTDQEGRIVWEQYKQNERLRKQKAYGGVFHFEDNLKMPSNNSTNNSTVGTGGGSIITDASEKTLINDLVWLEKRIMASKSDSFRVENSMSPIGQSITCRDCYAPPGRLNIIIHSTKDGPSVHSVGDGSALEGQLFQGDLIVAVDNRDTRRMTAEQVMSIMGERASKDRKITVLHYEGRD